MESCSPNLPYSSSFTARQIKRNKRLTRIYPTGSEIKSLPDLSPPHDVTSRRGVVHASPTMLLQESESTCSYHSTPNLPGPQQSTDNHKSNPNSRSTPIQLNHVDYPKQYHSRPRSIHPFFTHSISDPLLSTETPDPPMRSKRKSVDARSWKPTPPVPPLRISRSLHGIPSLPIGPTAKEKSTFKKFPSVQHFHKQDNIEHCPESNQTRMECKTRRYRSHHSPLQGAGLQESLPDFRLSSFLPSLSDTSMDSRALDSDSNNTASNNTSPDLMLSLSGTSSDTHSATSSFDHDAQLDLGFPKPPAIGAEISPLFSEEETDAVRLFLRKRWGVQQKLKKRNLVLMDANMVSPSSSYLILEDPVLQIREGAGDVMEDEGADMDFSWEAEEEEGDASDGGSRTGQVAPLVMSVKPRDLPAAGPLEGFRMSTHSEDIADVASQSNVLKDTMETLNVSASQENVLDDDVSLALRFLKTVDGGESWDAETRSWREGGSALPDSALDLTAQAGRAAQGSRARGGLGLELKNRADISNVSLENGPKLCASDSAQSLPSSCSGLPSPDQKHTKQSPSVTHRPLPRIARKISSMRSLNYDHNAAVIQNDPQDFPVPLISKRSSALDRLDASIAKLKAHNPMLHGKSFSLTGTATLKRSSKIMNVTEPQPQIPLKGREIFRSRSFATLPKRPPRDNIPTIKRTGLDAPFQAKSQPMRPIDGMLLAGNGHSTSFPSGDNVHGPKSFMNLTPEHEKQRPISGVRLHRQRVKKLLARASNGFIGWSRSLTGRT